jgi:membrane protease YdiL (CAAX protease family)
MEHADVVSTRDCSALPAARSRAVSVWSAFVGSPDYPANAADLRTVGLVGLRLPARASVAVAVTILVLLLDFSQTLLPVGLAGADRAPATVRALAVERFVLFLLVPLTVVLLGFRDRPSRYGVRLGDWRAGSVLVVVGCAVMTPIVLWFATSPDTRQYYGPSVMPLPVLVGTYAVDLSAAEFLFRGFLMFALIRVVGPFGVLLATMPFVFSHLGKPELELLSTLGGGLVYGWLAWRTGSIVWGSIGHTYILTLVTIAAGGAAVG